MVNKTAKGQTKRVIYFSRPDEPEGVCNGCGLCELFCSLQTTGCFNPQRSKIKVVSLGTGIDIPVTCQQCPIPDCQNVCPVDAIVYSKELGIVVLDEEICNGCRLCVPACPFGIMIMDPVTKKAAKCDLCGGEPACVSKCPSKVLATVGDDEIDQINRRRFAALLHSMDSFARFVPSGSDPIKKL